MSRPISINFVPAVHIILLYEYGNPRLYQPCKPITPAHDPKQTITRKLGCLSLLVGRRISELIRSVQLCINMISDHEPESEGISLDHGSGRLVHHWKLIKPIGCAVQAVLLERVRGLGTESVCEQVKVRVGEWVSE